MFEGHMGRGDIVDRRRLDEVLSKYRPEAVLTSRLFPTWANRSAIPANVTEKMWLGASPS